MTYTIKTVYFAIGIITKVQIQKNQMKNRKSSIILFLILLTFSFSAFSQTLQKLETRVYNWNKLSAVKTKTGELRKIFEGSTNELRYFEVHVSTLNPAVKLNDINMSPEMEELIIVKEGSVLCKINTKEEILGPGSVILISPGDKYKISNGGNSPAVYYELSWKIEGPVDMERSKLAGGSTFYDWDQIEYRTTSKGGVRSIMRRPTATLSELEMHVTTLNENTASHAEHVHDAEEIILVIEGEVEESINSTPYQAGPGSVILLMNKDSHGIRNFGKGKCSYFAFKWDI